MKYKFATTDVFSDEWLVENGVTRDEVEKHLRAQHKYLHKRRTPILRKTDDELEDMGYDAYEITKALTLLQRAANILLKQGVEVFVEDGTPLLMPKDWNPRRDEGEDVSDMILAKLDLPRGAWDGGGF